MWAGLFKNPKEKEPRNKPLPCSPTGEKAEKSPQSGKENLTAVSAVSISLMEKSYPLTMKISFYIALMLKISGFTFGELSRLKQTSSVQPDLCDIQPKRLKENSFPSADDAPLTLQYADAFIKLTASEIGLTLPSIPTPDEGVKTPSDADGLTTCFDAQLLAVPVLTLDASVQELATKGRHVDADDVLMKKTFK